MAQERNESKDGCTTHNITFCPDNKIHVLKVKAEIELKHQSSIDEAINQIVEEWAELKRSRQK
jgi:hypothetical protein